MPVKYSICIVTFNRLALFRKALEAIAEKSGGEYELFIWDNNSSDGTREFLQQLQPRDNWKIILSEENVGQTPAVNQCLKGAGGQFVFQIDDDVIELSQDWNVHLAKVIEMDKGIGYASPITSAKAESFLEEFKKVPGAKIESLGDYTLCYPGGGGFCCCTPKELFVSVGGFPEIGGLKYYNEDDRYKKKIFQKGYRMVYVAEVKANHYRAKHFSDPLEILVERKRFWQYLLEKNDWPLTGFAKKTITDIDRELVKRGAVKT